MTYEHPRDRRAILRRVTYWAQLDHVSGAVLNSPRFEDRAQLGAWIGEHKRPGDAVYAYEHTNGFDRLLPAPFEKAPPPAGIREAVGAKHPPRNPRVPAERGADVTRVVIEDGPS